MTQPNTETLKEELEHFRLEKEKVRKLVGQIGGKASLKRDRTLNALFILAIATLLILDFMRHLMDFSVPLPPLFSIELGVLLVSIKIIWMIHRSMKVEHFQFWILNSIEFRLNDISRRMKGIEEKIK
ncbi:hypothetical protein ACFL0G_01950 [Candidatus Zixiibacteriota bacterium]